MYFQHFNVGSINLRVNGKSIPAEPLRPNFTSPTPLVNRELTHLFMNTGSYRMDKGNCITRTQFLSGATLFPFDLNPDLCNGYHIHIAESGVINLEITWRDALAKAITILAHLSYDEIVIHKKGEIDFVSETI